MKSSEESEAREVRKLLMSLKVAGVILGMAGTCWGAIKLAVTLPEHVDAVERRVDRNTKDIEGIRATAQDQREILIRIDERGRAQDAILKELKDDVRRKRDRE